LLLLTAAALVPACGGGSSGGGAAVPKFVIAGVGGNFISTAGGNSTSAAGGKGGALLIQGQSGSGVHSLTGALSIDTSFQVPALVVNLGANPLTISATGSLTPPGTTGVVPGSSPGNATGLHVTNGATLTINADTGGGGSDAHLQFPNGVLVDAGCTIQMGNAAVPSDKVNLIVTASMLVFSGGTTFNSTGNANGGKGGDLKITCSGDIALRGDMSMSGGDMGTFGNAGNGGNLTATSTTAVYFTGLLLTAGGTALVAGLEGGSGGSVTLGGTLSGVFCSADIQTFGGSGRTGGGPGGSIMFAATDAETIVSGNLDTTGGTGLTPGAGGGDGGAISLSTNGFNVRVTGNWASDGGTGQAPSGIGGAGGAVTILQQNKAGASLLMPTQIVTGGMGLSVTISTGGGKGDGAAGAGGDVSITQNLDGIDASLAGLNPLTLAGYDTYGTNGGTGGTTGGDASSIRINNQLFTAAPGNPGAPNPAGPLFNGTTENEVQVAAVGGAGTAGKGGSGGVIQIYGGSSVTNSGLLGVAGGTGAVGGDAGAVGLVNMDLAAGAPTPLPDADAWVSNTAQIMGNGGIGTTGSGGSACTVLLVGHARLTNTGLVLTTAGSGGGASPGGFGSIVILVADGTITNSGVVNATGGGSPGNNGGGGGTLSLNAQHVTHNADVVLVGGNGLNAGGGGRAQFNSQLGGTVMHGNFNLKPGTGATQVTGVLIKDGVDLPLNAGLATY
jgi:hypothetical protein